MSKWLVMQSSIQFEVETILLLFFSCIYRLFSSLFSPSTFFPGQKEVS